MNILYALGWIIFTIVQYRVSKQLYKWVPTPFTMPVLTATALIIACLLIFHIPYEAYMKNGGDWITKLLGPGIVAFAIPLYKQRRVLKKYVVPISGGVIVGTVVAISSEAVIARMFGTDSSLILTALPKSVTMPVAMSVSEQIGGIPSLTAAFVMIAGITGVMMGPLLLKWSGVTNFIGKGIGVGCSSHIMGVAQSMKRDEREGVVGSVTMTLTAVLTCLLGPLLAGVFV